MAQICAEEAAERRVARLEDAQFRAFQLCSEASCLLRPQQNERNKLRVVERRQRRTADWLQTRLLCSAITRLQSLCIPVQLTVIIFEPLHLFKTAIDTLSDTRTIIIHADKMPAGEHVQRFNAPTIDEVATVIVDHFQSRSIILHRRNDQLTKVAKTHRCYDMYVKIEAERLVFVRLNQTKLRSEEYIHLRDPVVNDGNRINIGRLTTSPSLYAGSPRHMHEYAQDAITYIRHYRRPDLFVAFSCSPAWYDVNSSYFLAIADG
ncbi:unnamed protein product [Onchocerca ochengi]|uniref:Helitron_like_N domain-containing protein n=1 Tax=Onchocerca ochengi TaxID=42157 RepID=A0A182EHR1_ONCOC|nr:unnamed protein product [Onchocerca ochengi]